MRSVDLEGALPSNSIFALCFQQRVPVLPIINTVTVCIYGDDDQPSWADESIHYLGLHRIYLYLILLYLRVIKYDRKLISMSDLWHTRTR